MSDKSTAIIALDAEFTSKGELSEKHFSILEDAGIVPKGTPTHIISLFAYVCKEKKLSPFSKEIYLLGYFNKGTQKTDYSVITGIEGYRKMAHSSGLHAGVDAPRFDPLPDGSFKTLTQLMKEGGPKNETVCEVTVHKIVQGTRVPFTRPVLFKDYNTNQNKWRTAPENMLIKCAEAASLRAAFPRETSGVHTEDEFGNITGATIMEDQANMNLDQKIAAPTSDLTPAQQEVINAAVEKLKTLNSKEEVTAFWKSQGWGEKGSIIYEKVMAACVERGQQIADAAKPKAVEFSEEDKEVIETTSTVLPMYKTADEVDGYFAQSKWGGEGTDLYLEIQKMCADRKAQIAQEGGTK